MAVLPSDEYRAPERLHRLHQTKHKHKQIALAVHQRKTLQTRQKIAWAIQNRPGETLRFAQTTLAHQIKRHGKLPRYRSWAKILEAAPEVIARELLREDAWVQRRNSCHPFGNALCIYETHYSA